MATILLKNIRSLVSCDGQDRVYAGVDLLVQDGIIAAIGPELDRPRHFAGGEICPGKGPAGESSPAPLPKPDEVLDCAGMLCFPGLINTHHHLYQQFSRNLPGVQELELFDWLRALYEVWKHLDTEVVRLSSLTGMGELMKNGCTTCFDHHYVFPRGAGDLPAAQFSAADTLGIRFAASRGSMDLSRKDGGLPPDSVVQTVDEILRDCDEAITKWHDPGFGSMRTVALAPCSPFSVSETLLRETAALARARGVRLHTHLCETKDEERYTLERYGLRPLAYMERLGWVGQDVWYAHGIHFNDGEIRLLAETGTGIAHCPVSNMKLSSGVARLPELLRAGVRVGLAVDGSASQDGSDLLEELRVCYLLHRLQWSREAPSGYEILKLATRGSASLLGRDDIGSLAVGKCADLFLIDSRRPELAGALEDPKSLLATVGFRQPVDYTMVNGRFTVRRGRLCGVDEQALAIEAERVCRAYLHRG